MTPAQRRALLRIRYSDRRRAAGAFGEHVPTVEMTEDEFIAWHGARPREVVYHTLRRAGLIVWPPYGGYRLTEAGRAALEAA